MKTIRYIVLTILVASAVCQAQTLTDPGWFNAQRTDEPFLPDDSVTPAPTDPPNPSQFTPRVPPPAGIAEAITPEIQALARGLENNPVRIYNYVHDYISHVLYFGSKKGAQLTLLEKSGNDFDQCALLVALLRSAGYSPQYQFGWQGIPYAATNGTENDLQHWLGLNLTNTTWSSKSNYLAGLFWRNRGYPSYYILNDSNTMLFQRVWVTLRIAGTNYFLDPAFKVSDPIAGINLPSALGFSSSANLSNALMTAASGTTNTYSVSNMNETALRAALAGYTTNLLNYLQTNCPNAEVREVLSGRARYIDPWGETDLPKGLLFSTYYWDYPGIAEVNTLTWDNEPTNLMSKLSITFAGTNYQCPMPQLQGQRLSLTFDSGGTAQLWQDDALLAQNVAGGTGGSTNVVLGIDHPFGNWNWVSNIFVDTAWGDMVVTNAYQRTNATYALTYAFEPDWGWLQQRQNQLDAYRQLGYGDTSRQVVSETLNIMGLTWMLQTEWASHILEPQLGILPQYHHRFGRMAQEAGHGYYVDAYMQLAGFYSFNGVSTTNQDQLTRHIDLFSYFASSLENGIIEQLQSSNLVGASTVKMLGVGNSSGQPTYLANSANWTSQVRGQLTNYPNMGTLDALISSGYSLFLPQNGANRVAGTGSWKGYAYVAHFSLGGTNVAQFSISGNYQGAYISDPSATVNTPEVAQSAQAQPPYNTAAPVSTPVVEEAEPVNVVDGAFEVQATDLTLGQREPRGLALSRFYSSRRRSGNPAGMAPGWVHSYSVTAVEASAPQAGLGCTTPAQMAPMIAATCAAIAVYSQAQPSAKNWLVAALTAKWGADQLTANGVSVTLGHDTLQFIKQPDGRFTPPANCTWWLTKSPTYALQERHGRTFNFDSLGRLASILDPYTNVSLSLTYQASNWVHTVTDWKGRSLTFTYTGNPARLTQITDGSSPNRTVEYGYANTYSSQGDLTSVTDAENQTSNYAYDTNHQITATFDALGRLVVSNVYDGMNRIATQYAQGDTNKTWQFYWSGFLNVETDPVGGRRTHYYDNKSRQIAFVDELGGWHETYYDGQDHITWKGTPLWEYTQFIYDSNHNVTQKIDPLGFTNQYVYDNQLNLTHVVDERGSTSTFGYNSAFQLTGQTNGAGDWVTYRYNAVDGTLTNRTDSAGTTGYGYDGNGFLSSIAYPGTLGNESFVNNVLGDVLSHTDGRGFTTSFQYNMRRQLTNTVAPNNFTNALSFDAVGNVQAKRDASGFAASMTWSPSRKLLATTLPSTPQGVPMMTNIYDARDWLLSKVDALGNVTSYIDDAAGRVVATSDPLLRTNWLGFDADGRQVASTNALLEKTFQLRDARGYPIIMTNSAGRTVQMGFDPAGNQVTLTNRNFKAWQFLFDAANRLTNITTPKLRSTAKYYNDRGLVQSVTQPSTRTTSFGYDGKRRMTTRVDQVGTTAYKYDANNNLTNVSGPIGVNSWSFDANDRLSSYRDPDGNVVQYRYDANGNVTNLVYPGNRTVTYAYDCLNRLTNVTDWSGRATTLTYDLNSRLTSIIRPNGTVRIINYDIAGQTTNITEKLLNGAPIAFFRLNWDNGARLQWEFAAPLLHSNAVPARTMTYNDDNQIATFKGPTMGSAQTVGYDPDGNLISGPLTSDTFITYGYNARNQLTNAGGLFYAYDPAGNRVTVTNGANVTRFVINPNARLSQVLMRVATGITNYYIYGPTLLYEVSETAASTNTLTYHYDIRGTTIAMSDLDGNVTDRMEYSAYGMLTLRGGTNDTPFLYNGAYGVMTDANGLMSMRARYYNPYLCRFLNADPLGFAGGLNWYCYADGNPICKTDPFGLFGDSTMFWADLSVTGTWWQKAIAFPMGVFSATIPDAVAISVNGTGGFIGGGTVGVQAVGYVQQWTGESYSFAGKTAGPHGRQPGFATPQVSIGITISLAWSDEYNPSPCSWTGKFTEANFGEGVLAANAFWSDHWQGLGLGGSVGPVPLTASYFDTVDYQILSFESDSPTAQSPHNSSTGK